MVGILVLLLIGIVFLGWNQFMARRGSDKANALVVEASKKIEDEKSESERRNRESALKSAEAEKKLQEAGY